MLPVQLRPVACGAPHLLDAKDMLRMRGQVRRVGTHEVPSVQNAGSPVTERSCDTCAHFGHGCDGAGSDEWGACSAAGGLPEWEPIEEESEE